MPLLEVQDLRTWFPVRRGLFGVRRFIKAVDGVSFTLESGEVLAVIGESGSGKTTLGRTVLRLVKPTAGRIVFDGRDITDVPESELRWYRFSTAMVFQDPFGSLNPYHTVQYILEEPLILRGVPPGERYELVVKALEEVKLTPPEDFLRKYPHMLSGGQRQRVGIARALITKPRFIVADEPVSMLDVSIRAEILSLMRSLQEKHGIAMMYITHDIATAKYIADKVLVMYAGKMVEYGPFREVVKNPSHPYTQALINALPDPDPNNRFKMREVPPGEPPSLLNPPSGCRFHPRCPYAIKGKCDAEEPPMSQVKKGHYVSCWYTGSS
ncbi:ABC transporter ATP-binding protein [Pyrobaculum neutrophilum]|uniref:Oligopeptide/dipeptide ABC transporter, ATPase subunit n=1 Tax=Pyrobaculum neutrophilum (strain DSM 2338 / JCM 9278 / NBRC 100436 / V24Sta) TaxID=444157 RepID=B1Y9S6_PYRNV|nr:ABC transporter ATP-binding protein [Pyrobaculum neutrophilum]ACB40476.1 oligopeptide/dipeptide ABC transporter, ATPase subunit [Pyrobaculum neutrophilum V24Sta]